MGCLGGVPRLRCLPGALELRSVCVLLEGSGCFETGCTRAFWGQGAVGGPPRRSPAFLCQVDGRSFWLPSCRLSEPLRGRLSACPRPAGQQAQPGGPCSAGDKATLMQGSLMQVSVGVGKQQPMGGGPARRKKPAWRKGFSPNVCIMADVPPASGIQVYYEGLKATSLRSKCKSRGTKGSWFLTRWSGPSGPDGQRRHVGLLLRRLLWVEAGWNEAGPPAPLGLPGQARQSWLPAVSFSQALCV